MARTGLPVMVESYLQSVAQERMNASDVLHFVQDIARASGAPLTFQQNSEVRARYAVYQRQQGAQVILQGARDQLERRGLDQAITADMIGLATDARSQQARNLAPFHRVRVPVTMRDTQTGNLFEQWATVALEGSLPASMSGLLDTLQQQLEAGAAGSLGSFVSISGDIAITAV